MATLPSDFTGYMVDTEAFLTGLAARGVRPAHSDLHADHVTFEAPGRPRAPGARTITVVGVVATDELDCAVVTVDGSSDRPDGSTFHITISTAPGVHARRANDVLATKVATPVEPFDVPFHRV